MSADKKKLRASFRDQVFKRAQYRCQGPGCVVRATAETAETVLDAHHITDRNELPNGGYVKENGIALCKAKAGCHEKAEAWHATGLAVQGFTPDELYRMINSSRLAAEVAARKIKS